MLIQKLEANGNLCQMSLYSTGYLPGKSPRQREKRKQTTSEAKKRINERAQEWALTQKICANFIEIRDLFVCLTYAETPKNEGECLKVFHRKMRTELQKMGIEHTYIVVTTAHDMPDADTEVRLHHHLIMRGAKGEGMYKKLRDAIDRCWGLGTVDVRPLRQNEEFFRDTARYLLAQPTKKGARKYSCSRNLRPPNEPIRLRLPEAAAKEVEPPPGVVVINDERIDNEFGHYRYMVARIYDHKLFDAYWDKQRRLAAPDPWQRLQRRRYRPR